MTTPDSLAQKLGLKPKSKLLNLISMVNRKTDAPREKLIITARFLGEESCFKLPPTMMGSIGSAHGAKMVTAPEIKLSKIKNIFYLLFKLICYALQISAPSPTSDFFSVGIYLHENVLIGNFILLY